MTTNPFSSIDEFEALRAAALNGGSQYERYLRQQQAVNRRAATGSTAIRLPDRTMRMIEAAIASSRAVLLVGPPGTGKTEVLQQVIERIDQDPSRFGLSSDGVATKWVTPQEEWSFDSLVLGETVRDGELVSSEGDLLAAVREDRWLIIDEANRADMDRVLGGVLTWLSGKPVTVGHIRQGAARPLTAYLDWRAEPSSQVVTDDARGSITFQAGADWRLLGTYNAVDAQRVFRMGQALSRRFVHVPIPPASQAQFRTIMADRVPAGPLGSWLLDRVEGLYGAHLATRDAELGPGLFTNIPQYVEAALRLENRGTKVQALDVIDDEDDDATAESPVDYIAAPPLSYDGDLLQFDEVVAEELLAEAYLINVGYFVAKYDPDTLESLTGIIVGAGVINEANMSWFAENLHSMRA